MKGLDLKFPENSATAGFDESGKHRLYLTRVWGDGPLIMYIGLNPSNADGLKDDPTIRRLKAFTKSWLDEESKSMYGGFIICNLFSLISSDPCILMTAKEPVYKTNDFVIRTIYESPRVTNICIMWGDKGGYFWRDTEMLQRLKEMRVKPWCFGISKSGQPKHPLYLKKETELILYKP